MSNQITHALALEQRAIEAGVGATAQLLVARAQLHATLALVDAQELRVSKLPGSQALVDTIVHITRQTTYETAQDELDAIYEALRQYGHAV